MMILVPDDVKCRFCKSIFCCTKCRLKHEENSHAAELSEKKQEEYIASLCNLCNGQKLPFLSVSELLSEEIMQHVVDVHLPLKCDKCLKLFESGDDLKSFGKCCPDEEKMGDDLSVKENATTPEAADRIKTPDTEDLKSVTPLSEINKKWRRKSMEITKDEGTRKVIGGLERQTSTPMQANLLTTKNFTDSSTYSTSSIHFSSINSTSSSDSDAFSPPIIAPKQHMLPPISPQRPPKSSAQNRSRQKLPVQATPLRQVMSKSIQRAIQQHGHYRQTPFLQQRKMSFNSTSSSNECTSASLMKFPVEEAALDLRLSPAVRRSTWEHSDDDAVVPCQFDPDDLIDLRSHVEFEHIEVIIRRSEIKSETSASLTSFKSCASRSGRSGSMPEIQFTPKIVGNNMMKKTIAFQTPKTVERTTSFLMTAGLNETVVDDDNDADDVFYTPRATPIRVKRRPVDIKTPIEEENPMDKEISKPSPHNQLWSFMSSVMKIATRRSEDITESLSGAEKLLKISFKKATDFFVKRTGSQVEEYPSKRRRTSSISEQRTGSQSSPATKRQKIQPRKPIGRMQRLS